MAATATQVVAPVPQGVPNAPAAPIQSSSLWIGDLLPEVSEAMLYDIFNAVGPVASVRVCRDAVTRRSLGYAYVNFQSPTDADRALDTMNYEPIQGKSCRIMWCQRDPTVRRSGVGNIFVKGLDETIDNKALYDAFSIFGNILSVKVVLDGTGHPTGRGFVHFETAQDADDAIVKADGTLLKDKKIIVQKFQSRAKRLEAHGRTENQFKNVFAKNLVNVNDTELLELFAPFGTITSHHLPPSPVDGKPTHGFVCYADFESAAKAVEALNGKEVNGQVIYVGRAMKKSERSTYLRREYERRKAENQNRTRGVNLYIKNLEEDVDDDKLRTLFAEYGTITSAAVMRDPNLASRGFGFVCFSTQEEATRALTEMNGRIIQTKPLYVAIAQSRDERRQHLNMQFRQRMQFQRQPGFMPQANMYPQQMMYLGAPLPFQQRQPGPYFGPRPAGGRYGQPQFGVPFGGQGMVRAARPPYPRQAAPPGARPIMPGAAPQARLPSTRYTGQARNVQQPIQTQQPNIIPNATQHLATILASSDPDRQKQILGDQLYPLVAERHPQLAGKLTGMLLQMDNSELLHLLEDQATLQQELEKANDVLRQHMQ